MKRVLDYWSDHPVLVGAGLTFLGNLLFPRLSHRMRWRTRLGLRDTLLVLAAQLALAVLVIRWAERMAEWQRRTYDEVRRHLGREPTPLEVEAYLMERLDRD
jgi:hypothetical protein